MMTAPSHCLKQCWLVMLITSKVQWYSFEGNFSSDTLTSNKIHLKITYLNFISNVPGANELKEAMLLWLDISLVRYRDPRNHYSEVIMSAVASQITGISIACSTVCSGTDLRKYQTSASLAFVRGIHRWPVDSSHKGPVTRKMFLYDDVIMIQSKIHHWYLNQITDHLLISHQYTETKMSFWRNFGLTGCCQIENFHCHRWWKFR